MPKGITGGSTRVLRGSFRTAKGFAHEVVILSGVSLTRAEQCRPYIFTSLICTIGWMSV